VSEQAAGEGVAERSSHAVRWIAVAVGVVLLFLVAIFAFEKQSPGDTNFELRGKQAPELTGATLQGAKFTLARPPGKWVVVNFYATWCQPCQLEAPEIAKFAQEHAARGDAQVVSVAFDPPDVRQASKFFAATGGPPGPVVTQQGDVVAVNWSVNKVPETYLVAPNGIIVWKSVQPVTQELLDKVIQEAGGDAALPPSTAPATSAPATSAPPTSTTAPGAAQ
jgi:thiol-disulfide isomerase/thioredoxin